MARTRRAKQWHRAAQKPEIIMEENKHYVYVYIDPRNGEEFYVGKGCGSRKEAHQFDKKNSKKTKRIKEIKNDGEQPTIRVVAKNLSDKQALLVEKTLLWKWGPRLTNDSTGQFSENFRPENSLHIELPGFDYQNGIYYYNVGEGKTRNWDDYTKFNFISAGGGKRWRYAMLGFEKGDIFAAYLKGFGFVGIGQIIETAKPIREVSINGKPLLSLNLSGNRMARWVNSDKSCEYVARVKWLRKSERPNAKWRHKSGLYTSQLVRASLDRQPKTIEFLEREFGIKFSSLAI